jgi:hypothetical protein
VRFDQPLLYYTPAPCRYDVDLDGYITFHEFLQNVIHEVLGVDQDSNALRRVQAR